MRGSSDPYNAYEGMPLADRLGPLISYRATPEPSHCGSPLATKWQDVESSRNEYPELSANGQRRAAELNGYRHHDSDLRSLSELGGDARSRQGDHEPREEWRRICERARIKQEHCRASGNFKNRLNDPRVAVAMRDLWDDSVEFYGKYSASISKTFLLSSRKFYTPTPLATCRIQPSTGMVTLRRDVRMILEKGICRTEKHNWRQFHSLISFKCNDLLAMYIKVAKGRPMTILFMTRYEGPVVFFFTEFIALRVILVLMQTKFIERLHSAVPENETGIYAIQVFQSCQEWVDNLDVGDKHVFVAQELVNTRFETLFENGAYPEHEDNWSDGESDSENITDDVDYILDLKTGHGQIGGKRPRYNTPAEILVNDDEDDLDRHFIGTSFVQASGKMQTASSNVEVFTKKQREQARLEKLIAQRLVLEEEIKRQQEAVEKTRESFEEIEDRITRLSSTRPLEAAGEDDKNVIFSEDVSATTESSATAMDQTVKHDLMDL